MPLRHPSCSEEWANLQVIKKPHHEHKSDCNTAVIFVTPTKRLNYILKMNRLRITFVTLQHINNIDLRPGYTMAPPSGLLLGDPRWYRSLHGHGYGAAEAGRFQNGGIDRSAGSAAPPKMHKQVANDRRPPK
jgi:hypothetical protein